MVKEFKFGRMDQNQKENEKMIFQMDQVHLSMLMEISMKENELMEKLMDKVDLKQ